MIAAILLSVPHSGTKMLCSALDSHPDIICPHEHFRHNKDQQGRPFESLKELGKRGKVVVGHAHFSDIHWRMFDGHPVMLLTRDPTNVAMSALTTARRDLVPSQPRVQRIYNQRRLELHLLAPLADLTVSYEDLCGNSNMVVMPEVWSKRFCDFLGVNHHPMKASFVKGDDR